MKHDLFTISAFLVGMGAFTGCSLMYDDDVFAVADAFVPIDPSTLSVESAEPSEIFEGMGHDAESRAVPIVVHGKSISQGARIRVLGGGIDVDEEAVVSGDGTMAATVVRVPVDENISDGAREQVTIEIRQDAAGDDAQGETVSQETSIEVVGLAEFHPPAGELLVADLSPKYSEITIDAAISLVGSEPARFVATGGITVTSEIRADGGTGTNATRAAGGHLGGGPAENGQGPGGGGRGGQSLLSGAGGGGGGNLENGVAGQGDSAGAGGSAADAVMLFPLGNVVGQGGGGGGSGIEGGGGGGAVELRTEGPLVVEAGALISANGAAGENSGSCLAGGGAAGGGSGGAILLRSASTLDVAASATLSVAGGQGGSAANCRGGNGSDGQVRVDYQVLNGSNVAGVRGPTWAQVPGIVRSRELEATLAGQLGATYFVSANAEAPQSVTLSQTEQDVPLVLEPGLNSICARVAADGNLGQPESIQCVSVAYLP